MFANRRNFFIGEANSAMIPNRRNFDVCHRRSKVCLLTEEILMSFIGEANSTMFANRRNFDVFHGRGKV